MPSSHLGFYAAVACACNACVRTASGRTFRISENLKPPLQSPSPKKQTDERNKDKEWTWNLTWIVKKDKRTCICVLTVKLTCAHRGSLGDEFYVPRQSFPFIIYIKNMFLTIRAEKHPQLVRGCRWRRKLSSPAPSHYSWKCSSAGGTWGEQHRSVFAILF